MAKELDFTERDLELIRLITDEGLSKTEAARRVGFKGKSQSALINSVNLILERYESKATSKEIFRLAGVTERYLATKLKQIIDTGKNSEKLKAIEIASKCLGMQRDVDVSTGAMVQINVNQGMRQPDYSDGTFIEVKSIDNKG